MNEVYIKNFLELTEEFLQKNRDNLSQTELDSVTELYEDLTAEFSRQQLYDELYH